MFKQMWLEVVAAEDFDDPVVKQCQEDNGLSDEVLEELKVKSVGKRVGVGDFYGDVYIPLNPWEDREKDTTLQEYWICAMIRQYCG